MIVTHSRILCGSFDCELQKNSQFAIIKISQSKPNLWYVFMVTSHRSVPSKHPWALKHCSWFWPVWVLTWDIICMEAAILTPWNSVYGAYQMSTQRVVWPWWPDQSTISYCPTCTFNLHSLIVVLSVCRHTSVALTRRSQLPPLRL